MPNQSSWEQAEEAAAAVLAKAPVCPHVGIVLGSGLGSLAERVCDPTIIPYREIPGLVPSTVPGHEGRLFIGLLGQYQVAMMQGRVHYYEGYTPQQITLPIRLMQRLGVRVLILTNAAGGINKAFHTGDLMLISDHINFLGLAGEHPLRGPNDERLGPRFPEMWRAYDAALLELARDVARQQSISLHEGVYAMVSGPSFETPAEVRMLRALGADAVGMSTAPEVVVARHAGIRVLGISLISNQAVDSLAEQTTQPSHEEVLLAGQAAVPRLAALIEGILNHPNLN